MAFAVFDLNKGIIRINGKTLEEIVVEAFVKAGNNDTKN